METECGLGTWNFEYWNFERERKSHPTMEEKRLKISGISETSKIQELEQISDPGFYVTGQALRN